MFNAIIRHLNVSKDKNIFQQIQFLGKKKVEIRKILEI
tara:strand:- start:548 stop:661 length:114 start_codon:yes stop_codon:yes gene_type:complete